MRAISFAIALALAASAPHADDLDRAIARRMQREQTPALTFAVVRHGQIVRQGAYGLANLEWKSPATIHTRFEVASVSKMFVGAAVRLLIEQHRLDPEDPLGRYLEGVPPGWSAIRVRHLLTMSSGLPEDFGGDLIPYNQDVTTPYDDASMLRAFFTLKISAPTGTRFVYSSPGYAMLSMIVAKIAGVPFAQFARERLFDPAGMRESSYIDNAAVVPERAEGYRKGADGEIRKGWYLGPYLHARPDDGLLTTTGDLARWVIALERGAIVQSPEALWEATASDSGRALDYSYGWMTATWLGHRRLEHAGGLRTGFHSFLARYPDDDLTIAVATNCDWSRVRDYVNLLSRSYLHDAPDLDAVRPDADQDPAATRRMAAALASVAHGAPFDASIFTDDATDPAGPDDVAGFLKGAGAFTYAGRMRLRAAGLRVHGHQLVSCVTLRTSIEGEDTYVTLYAGVDGKVAYLELSN